MEFQCVLSIPGQIRFRIPRLSSEPDFGAQLQQLVHALPAVTRVVINPPAKSIRIFYQSQVVSADSMTAALLTCIEQAAGESTPTSTPDNPTPQIKAQPASHNPLSDPIMAAELPNWLEQKESPSQVSDHLDLAEIVNSNGIPATLSQGQLAKRLGVTSQALSYRRSKPDFIHWSRRKDPDSQSWKYHPQSRLFYPTA